MSGDGVVAHNRRTYFAENVDPTRTHLNVEYCYTPIEEAYHQLFDAALAEFNAKQKRKDRCIENYYEKIRDGKQEKPFYEVIFQVGNKDDMGTAGENAELAKTILDKYYRSFFERNPQLHVYSAHLHMDEATPHLHIDFIPFTTGSKRGLSTRVSLKQALADQGITGEGRSLTERDLWVKIGALNDSNIDFTVDLRWEHDIIAFSHFMNKPVQHSSTCGNRTFFSVRIGRNIFFFVGITRCTYDRQVAHLFPANCN